MTAALEQQLYDLELQRRALKKEANQAHSVDFYAIKRILEGFTADVEREPATELWHDTAMQHAANLIPRLQYVVNRNLVNRKAFQDRAWALGEAADNIIRMLGWDTARLKEWSRKMHLEEGP